MNENHRLKTDHLLAISKYQTELAQLKEIQMTQQYDIREKNSQIDALSRTLNEQRAENLRQSNTIQNLQTQLTHLQSQLSDFQTQTIPSLKQQLCETEQRLSSALQWKNKASSYLLEWENERQRFKARLSRERGVIRQMNSFLKCYRTALKKFTVSTYVHKIQNRKLLQMRFKSLVQLTSSVLIDLNPHDTDIQLRSVQRCSLMKWELSTPLNAQLQLFTDELDQLMHNTSKLLKEKQRTEQLVVQFFERNIELSGEAMDSAEILRNRRNEAQLKNEIEQLSSENNSLKFALQNLQNSESSLKSHLSALQNVLNTTNLEQNLADSLFTEKYSKQRALLNKQRNELREGEQKLQVLKNQVGKLDSRRANLIKIVRHLSTQAAEEVRNQHSALKKNQFHSEGSQLFSEYVRPRTALSPPKSSRQSNRSPCNDTTANNLFNFEPSILSENDTHRETNISDAGERPSATAALSNRPSSHNELLAFDRSLVIPKHERTEGRGHLAGTDDQR